MAERRLHGRPFQTNKKWFGYAVALACISIAVFCVSISSAWSFAFFTAFLAVTFGLIVSAACLAGLIGNVMLIAASCTACFALIEGACIYVKPEIRLTGESSLIEKGSPLGWALRPGSHAVRKTIDGHPIYSVVYGIDEPGHRATMSAAHGPGFVFLGDSFTFGEGVPDADTLPQSFADLLKRTTRIENLGVPAYSPSQVLRELQLRMYDDVLSSGRGFFLLTAAWHVDRTACKDTWVAGAPRYISTNHGLAFDGACQIPSETFIATLLKRTAIYQVLVGPRLQLIDANDIATYIDIVSEAARTARAEYNVPLRVIYLRNAGYLRFTGVTDDEIMTRMRARGVEVLDLTLPHEGKTGFAIAGDGHPNGAGNRLRARMLLDALGGEKSALASTPPASDGQQ